MPFPGSQRRMLCFATLGGELHSDIGDERSEDTSFEDVDIGGKCSGDTSIWHVLRRRLVYLVIGISISSQI